MAAQPVGAPEAPQDLIHYSFTFGAPANRWVGQPAEKPNEWDALKWKARLERRRRRRRRLDISGELCLSFRPTTRTTPKLLIHIECFNSNESGWRREFITATRMTIRLGARAQ